MNVSDTRKSGGTGQGLELEVTQHQPGHALRASNWNFQGLCWKGDVQSIQLPSQGLTLGSSVFLLHFSLPPLLEERGDITSF